MRGQIVHVDAGHGLADVLGDLCKHLWVVEVRRRLDDGNGALLGIKIAESLARILSQDRCALGELELMDWKFSEDAVLSIVEALKKNKSLRELYLGDCRVGDAGAIAIAEALKANSSITSLHFHGNSGIRESGKNALLDAVRQNHALTDVNLCVGATFSQDIEEAAKRNKELAMDEAM